MSHVCILNGIHRGAVIAVGECPVVVGGHGESDALLSDDSAEGIAARLSANADGTLAVEAVHGGPLRNGRRLRAGRRAALGEGAVLTLGDIEIARGETLSAATAQASLRDRRRATSGWVAVCAACILVFAVIGAVGGPAGAFGSWQSADRAAAPVRETDIRRDPLIELTRALERQGLSEAISVRRSEAGQIRATGAVDEDERARWKTLVRWFDGHFGGATTLVADLTERRDGYVMPFRIASVHSEPNAHVVLHDGRSYPVGSILPGGWELRGVANLKIELFREGQSLLIAF